MAGALRMTSGMLSQGLVSLLLGLRLSALFFRVNSLSWESDSFGSDRYAFSFGGTRRDEEKVSSLRGLHMPFDMYETD
jgi:hypothetical protein